MFSSNKQIAIPHNRNITQILVLRVLEILPTGPLTSALVGMHIPFALPLAEQTHTSKCCEYYNSHRETAKNPSGVWGLRTTKIKAP